jgi:calcium-dependent protein kinase
MTRDFLRGCLQKEEKDRFSWDELYRHPLVVEHFREHVGMVK